MTHAAAPTRLRWPTNLDASAPHSPAQRRADQVSSAWLPCLRPDRLTQIQRPAQATARRQPVAQVHSAFGAGLRHDERTTRSQSNLEGLRSSLRSMGERLRPRAHAGEAWLSETFEAISHLDFASVVIRLFTINDLHRWKHMGGVRASGRAENSTQNSGRSPRSKRF